jgi:methylmalonyl-CoA carboxyltransferase small subunit
MRINITIDGKVYEVDVEVAEPEPPVTLVRSAPRSGGGGAPAAPRASSGAAGDRTLENEDKGMRSPLSGVVSQVDVEVGQEVTVDQPLLVLEAMKMFTTITSNQEGKVKAIDVAKGDGVKQGQLLIEFE